MSDTAPTAGLVVAGGATLALLVIDPWHAPHAALLALGTYLAWAHLRLPPWRARHLRRLLPALGGSVGLTLLAWWAGTPVEAAVFRLGGRALAIALVWVRVGTLLSLPVLAAVTRHRLRLATAADLLLVVDRMGVLLSRELTRQVRAVQARAPIPRKPGRLGLLVRILVGAFRRTGRRARWLGFALDTRGFSDHLPIAPVCDGPVSLVEVGALLLVLAPILWA